MTTDPTGRPSILDPDVLRRTPVGVLGSGVSGQAVCELLGRMKCASIAYDEREGHAARRSFGAEEAREHELVVYSPGFPLDHPWLRAARTAGCACLGEMEFGFHFWDGEIIAVTGTNGKTTLAEFLTFLLKRIGQDAVAVGNNGYPLSRLAARAEHSSLTAVCEISSFQAESLERFRADTLFWTNFSETHLDRYDGPREYFLAKWRLLGLLRKPNLYLSESVAQAARRFGCDLPPCATITDCSVPLDWELPEDSAFAAVSQRRNLNLLRRYWIDCGRSEAALREAAGQFRVREHRFQRVATLDGASYWNDSKATNFAAALGALENFDRPVFWIGGGEERGGDLTAFARALAPRLRGAFLVGATGGAMLGRLQAEGVPAQVCASVAEAVGAAREAADPGDAVLFSPGFSSHDAFRNYVERGVCFKSAVLGLKSDSTID